MSDQDTSNVDLCKLQAKRLKKYLANAGINIKHTNALEAVAQMHGFNDFHSMQGRPIEHGFVLGARASSLEDVLMSRITKPIDQNIGDFTLEASEALIDAQNELLDEIDEYVFPFYHQDCVLTAARIELSPYDGFALLRAVPNIFSKSIVELTIQVASYIRDVAIPHAAENELDEYVGEELVRALTRAHASAGFYAYHEKNYVRSIEQLRLAGQVALSSEEEECPYTDGERVAQVLALLYLDIEAAASCIPEEAEHQDIYDECVHFLRRLSEGVSTNGLKGPMKEMLRIVLKIAEDDVGSDELRDQCINHVIVESPLDSEGFSGEWLEVDELAALSVYLRRNPDVKDKIRSVV